MMLLLLVLVLDLELEVLDLANVLKEPSVTFIAKFKIHHCRE